MPRKVYAAVIITTDDEYTKPRVKKNGEILAREQLHASTKEIMYRQEKNERKFVRWRETERERNL